MSITVKLRRGTTTQHSTFTGEEAEVTVDTTKDVVVVHDGVTAGGHPMVKASALATVATTGDYNDLINTPASGGTVTSVALSAPTGFAVTGSPVTTTGTLALGFAAGYTLPTTTKQSQWDTAYGWGDHAAAGYLDSSDIGVTVQGYSAVLAGTTASFTTADETKLDGIAAGAEVNVNADWNAVSGDAQILNKPTLYSDASVDTHLNTGTAGTGEVLSWNGTDYDWVAASTGSVTSVTGTSPVASSGGATPAISLASGYGDTQNPYASKTANFVLAAPNGSSGVPTFRAVVAADIPTLNQNTTGTAANVTGIVAVANGGSGTATPSLVAGTNVTITGSWPNQTVAASGGGGSPLTISNKTGAYTVVAGDLGTIINCTSGTFTVSLTAAATLGAGFNVTVWNTSNTVGNAITIDPNGAETIDGVATLILRRGEGIQIVCDGTNFQTGNEKVLRGYAENLANNDTRPNVTGSSSIAIGAGSRAEASNGAVSIGLAAVATANAAFAAGFQPQATGVGSTSVGYTSVSASSFSTAIGQNSAAGGSQTVTGAGAMALGGSYASGTDSFAAGVANNTSTYGARQANALALGSLASANITGGIAIGRNATADNGNDAIAIGNTAYGSATNAISIGANTRAWAQNTVALGNYSSALTVGKFTYASNVFAAHADAQFGLFVLRRSTTDATATGLTTDGSAPDATDQIILPNNSAFAFTGTIIARQQAAGGSNFAAWEIKGAILRGANAASTTIGSFNINALSATAGAAAWVVALSADTTNGGLAVTVTGAAATNIRWVATVQTSEVTFA